ncbi:MAG: ABC transporter ATP-binding protein [Caulobacteraceae bacterium]
MSEPVLEIRDLTRNYQTGQGRLEVLKGLNLTVQAGEVVGLLGPSGSGKSSLLHAAGLLEQPTSGAVLVGGRDCVKLSDRTRTRVRLEDIGFIYQFHHLLPEFTALENVLLPMLMLGRPREAARRRATVLLTDLGLQARMYHQPAQLSGGEAQRVAVARALANRPQLLLADEPTGNLDPDTSEAVFASLHHLVRSTGVAAVIATHNFSMVKHMDKVMVLKHGKLEQAK